MSALRFLPDRFTQALVVAVVMASFFPVSGSLALPFAKLTHFAIALLFFMHGAKLSREAVIAGMTHWRLHLVVFASTFVFFPILGLLLKPLLLPLMTPAYTRGCSFSVLCRPRFNHRSPSHRWRVATFLRRCAAPRHRA